MQLSLRKKLFGGILLSNALIIVLVALLAQWNLRRDFEAFLFQQESRHLPVVAEELARLYAAGDGWLIVVRRPHIWHGVLEALGSGRTDRLELRVPHAPPWPGGGPPPYPGPSRPDPQPPHPQSGELPDASEPSRRFRLDHPPRPRFLDHDGGPPPGGFPPHRPPPRGRPDWRDPRPSGPGDTGLRNAAPADPGLLKVQWRPDDAPAPDWAPPPVPPPQVSDHPDARGLSARLQLLDADRQRLLGPDRPADTRAVEQAIALAGKTVGWLVLHPFDSLDDELAEEYESTQRRNLWIIAALAFLATSLIATLLADHLLRRLAPVSTGARRLAGGHYDVELDTRGGDELARLAMDFNRLAATLRETEYTRQQWVADIAHELRTPLAVLRAQLEAVQDGVRTNDAGAVQTLLDEVHRLSRLVGDLYQLSMSDLGAVDYRMQPVDLAALLADALDRFDERLAQAEITLHADGEHWPAVTIEGDATRLDQLFTNLLENSARYTDAGGRLEIELQAFPGFARIAFRDSAPGVPTDALPRLFDRLYRVERSRSRAHGGSGLGLAIARNIVFAHGGTIRAAASALGGVEIIIELPRAGAVHRPDSAQ